MKTVINANKLPDFIFKNFAALNTQRVISIALPFLALNSKTARLSSIGVGFYQCYTLWNTTDDKTTTGRRWGDAALLVSSTALGYFFPVHQLMFSSGVFFAIHGYKLAMKEDKAATLYQIANQTIHLSSIYYNKPALIVASLLSQAAGELHQVYKEKKTPERLASLLLAAIRVHKAYTYLPRDIKPAEKPVQKSAVNPYNSDESPKATAQTIPVQPEQSVQESSKYPDQPLPRKIPANKAIQNKKPIAPPKKPVAQEPIHIDKDSAKQNSDDSPKSAPEAATESVDAVPTPPLPLRQMTEADWISFISKFPEHIYKPYGGLTLRSGPLLDLKSSLQRQGFTAEIEGINFQNRFMNCNFQGLSFKNCVFKENLFRDCVFDQVLLDNCSFKRCDFAGLEFLNSRLIGCNFSKSSFQSWESSSCLLSNLELIDCNFHKARLNYIFMNQVQVNHSSFSKAFFLNSRIKDSSFSDCDFSLSSVIKSVIENTSLCQADLTEANWIESQLNQLKIQQGKLSESSFLLTSAANSQLIDCDLKNALLLDAKSGFDIQGGTPHQITKPIVALGWDFEKTGPMTRLIRKALRDNGALVLKYIEDGDNYPEKYTTPLEEEASTALAQITPSEQSIAQQLLQNAVPHSKIDRLKRQAAGILKHADGLVIPGGGDIESRFYNPSAEVKVSYRTLIELALISEAHQRKVPTMGICRGAQLINVFFGGTLINVSDQFGTHKLEWTDSPYRKNLQQTLPKNFEAESMHGQAVDQVGKGLHVILKRGTVPKMLVSEDGNFIASQIHPECYIENARDLQNMKFFQGKTIEEIQKMNSIETQVKIENIFKEMQAKIQDQFPSDNTLKEYFKAIGVVILSEMKELTQATTFITSNKNIYQYFMEKVEKFRTIFTDAFKGG